MTPKQQRFIEEYGIDLNATQAAIRAGYSPKTASSQGERLLRNDEVKLAIIAVRRAADQRATASTDDVLRELDAIGFARLTDVVSWGPEHFTVLDSESLSPSVKAAVKSVKVKRRRATEGTGEDFEVWEIEEISVTMHDKVRALELGGKHRGMFADKIEVGGQIDVHVHEQLTALRGLSVETLRGFVAPKLLAPPTGEES